jgi:hypothetical protein
MKIVAAIIAALLAGAVVGFFALRWLARFVAWLAKLGQ